MNKFSARRARLRSLLAGQNGIVIFVGNVDSAAQYRDNCYKWRQDSNWLYYFGIDEPRFAAVMDLDSGIDTVFADDFGIDDIIWTGPMPSVASLARDVAGAGRSASYEAFGKEVRVAIAGGRKVHFLPVVELYSQFK